MVRLQALMGACVLALANTGVAQAAAPSPPPPVEVYGHLPTTEQLSLSPSGNRMVSIGTVSGKRVVLARTVTGEVLLAAPVGDNKVREVQWVDDDHVLVTISATANWGAEDRTEEVFTLSLELSTKKSGILFDRNGKFLVFHQGVRGTKVIGGKPYAFIANVPKEGVKVGSRLATDTDSYFTRNWPDLWRIDLSTGGIDVAAKGTENIYQWVLAPDGGVVAYAYVDRLTSKWTVYREGQQALYSRQSPRMSSKLAGLGRTADSVTIFDQSGEGEQLVEVKLDATVQPLAPGQNVTGLLHNPVTGLLEGVVIDNRDFHFFDKALQARIDAAVKPFAGRNITIQSYTNGLDKVVLHTDGATDSGTFWLVDLKGHKADIIDNDFPTVSEDQTGAVSRIHYKASDGFDLDGILTLPSGRAAKGLPVVVLPHGGPIGYYDRVRFDWMAQAFASRGYAVFQPNYRGSGGHGPAFEQAGFGEFGRRMLTDMSDGLAHLAKEGVIDPKRGCIVGASYGGYAAMAGVTVQNGVYRCAVAVSGLSDLPAMLKWEEDRHGQGSSTIKYLREAMGVSVPGAPSVASISPAFLASRADAPLLMIHGRDDTVVPLEQSQRMERAMKAAGKPVQLIITEKEDHYLSREASRVATLTAAVAFVEKNNPAH